MKEKTVPKLQTPPVEARNVLTNPEQWEASANSIAYNERGWAASFLRSKLISGDGQEGCSPMELGYMSRCMEQVL